MFGLSLISTKKLNHLASECSKLAIAFKTKCDTI